MSLDLDELERLLTREQNAELADRRLLAAVPALLAEVRRLRDEAQRNCETCFATGAADERAAVVAWLREGSDGMSAMASSLLRIFADQIEHGDHREVNP